MSDTIWDPLRRKEVALTPEEKVRQWFIAEVLSKAMKVPMHMMSSEVQFSYGSKKYRADILILDRNARRLAVVECKRPDVVIDAAVLEQALRYNNSLDVGYIMLTNGHSTVVCRRNVNGFEQIASLPDYATMSSGMKCAAEDADK